MNISNHPGMAESVMQISAFGEAGVGKAIIVVLFFVSNVTAAVEPVWLGVNAGTGINDWLIQSGSTRDASVLGIDLHWPVAGASWFSWLGVDALSVNAHGAELKGHYRQSEEALSIYGFSFTGRGFFTENRHWAAEFGPGYAHLSADHFEAIRMAGRDNFMLDFALVFTGYARWETSARYRHFSNAYTDTPNPGLDYVVVQIARSF